MEGIEGEEAPVEAYCEGICGTDMAGTSDAEEEESIGKLGREPREASEADAGISEGGI